MLKLSVVILQLILCSKTWTFIRIYLLEGCWFEKRYVRISPFTNVIVCDKHRIASLSMECNSSTDLKITWLIKSTKWKTCVFLYYLLLCDRLWLLELCYVYSVRYYSIDNKTECARMSGVIGYCYMYFFIVIAKNIICHETRGPSLCAVCMISQYVHVLLGVPDISPQPKHIYEGWFESPNVPRVKEWMVCTTCHLSTLTPADSSDKMMDGCLNNTQVKVNGLHAL